MYLPARHVDVAKEEKRSSCVSSVGLHYGKKQGIARYAALLLVFSFACLPAVLLTAALSVLYSLRQVQAPHPGYSPAAAHVRLACEVVQLAGVAHHCQPFPSRVTIPGRLHSHSQTARALI